MQDLQVSVENAAGLERRMRVNVPAARIEEAFSARLRSVGRTASIRGYRPGRIPDKVLRQRFGDQVRQEVVQAIVEETYSEALAREQLRPAAMPRIEPESIAEGADLSYTAVFEIYPEIALTGLDALVVDQPTPAFDDGDLDFVIQSLRRQRAHWHTVERPARTGDRVVVDFEGKMDGQPMEGGSGEEVSVVLGEGRMIADFERQLEGLEAGGERDFTVTFPSDYPNASLAGRQAEFHVKARDVAEQHLPEVDAELIRGFGIESGAVEEFHAEVRRNMENEFVGRSRADIKRQLLDQLLAANPVALPEVLVEQECAGLQSEAMRNLGIEDVKQAPDRKSFRPNAERRVRLGLLIGEIIRGEKIGVDRERVRQRIDEVAAGYSQPEEVRKVYQQNRDLLMQVENAVLEDQVIDWLIGRATSRPKATTFRALVGG
jgi:trigger factor